MSLSGFVQVRYWPAVSDNESNLQVVVNSRDPSQNKNIRHRVFTREYHCTDASFIFDGDLMDRLTSDLEVMAFSSKRPHDFDREAPKIPTYKVRVANMLKDILATATCLKEASKIPALTKGQIQEALDLLRMSAFEPFASEKTARQKAIKNRVDRNNRAKNLWALRSRVRTQAREIREGINSTVPCYAGVDSKLAMPPRAQNVV